MSPLLLHAVHNSKASEFPGGFCWTPSEEPGKEIPAVQEVLGAVAGSGSVAPRNVPGAKEEEDNRR